MLAGHKSLLYLQHEMVYHIIKLSADTAMSVFSEEHRLLWPFLSDGWMKIDDAQNMDVWMHIHP